MVSPSAHCVHTTGPLPCHAGLRGCCGDPLLSFRTEETELRGPGAVLLPGPSGRPRPERLCGRGQSPHWHVWWEAAPSGRLCWHTWPATLTVSGPQVLVLV